MQEQIEVLYKHYLEHPNICTDSRKVEAGCLFFALVGEKFDGNVYAREALRKGAAIVVVSDPSVLIEGDNRFILVHDTLVALQKLARFHRRHLSIPLIAITGSNGKTTTKELTAAVLSAQYKCHFTKGNFNNHIGVPLTLLSMPLDTDVAVIEMGANHPGDIDELCRIAEPSHGLITNVGKAHLEGFGSFEGVKRTKGEMYHYLNINNGLVFVNADEKFLSTMAKKNRKQVLYGKSEDLSIEHRPIEVRLTSTAPFISLSFLNVDGKEVEVHSQIMGLYNFNNLMTAIAIGKYFKVPAAKIKAALEAYVPSNNRSQLVQHGKRTFILDAYNANPSSMAGALEHFAQMPDERPKYAILGDMFELGEESMKEHKKILRQATCCCLGHVIYVGHEFGKAKGRQTNITWLENVEKLSTWLETNLPQEALVLVKGSRGMQLERILDSV